MRTSLLRTRLLLALSTALWSEDARALPMLVVDLGGNGTAATILVGGTITVSITGEEIPIDGNGVPGDGDGLFGFGFTITFDPAGVSPSAPAIHSQWTGNSSITVGSGEVGMTANRQGESSGPAGSGVALASLTLEGLVAGDYTISLGPLTGPGDNILFDGTCLDAANGVACTGENTAFFGSGALLTVVPEPRLVALLAAAFVVCWHAARRISPGGPVNHFTAQRPCATDTRRRAPA